MTTTKAFMVFRNYWKFYTAYVVWGKVMFSEASVILSTIGGRVDAWYTSWTHTRPDKLPLDTVPHGHTLSWTHPPLVHTLWIHTHPSTPHPPPPDTPPRHSPRTHTPWIHTHTSPYGQLAVGTHPTGMHSCF